MIYQSMTIEGIHCLAEGKKISNHKWAKASIGKLSVAAESNFSGISFSF
jgi:hypothetical protein